MGEAGDLNNNFHSADILEDKEDLTFPPSTRSQGFKHQRTQQQDQQQHCRLVHHQHLLQAEEHITPSSSSSGHASATMLEKSDESAKTYANMLEKGEDSAKAYAAMLEKGEDSAKAYAAMLEKGEDSAKTYATMLEKGDDSNKTYALRPRNGSRRGLCYRDAVELDWSPASPPVEEEEQERATPTKNLRMSKSGYGRTTPLSKYRRKTANAKERQRMRQINVAFEALRRSLSRGAEASVHRQQQQPRGLTKISTLRLAISYIQALSAILGKDTSSASDGSFIESSICKDEDISSYDSNSDSLQFFVTSSFDLKSEAFSSYQLNGSDFESAADGAKNRGGGVSGGGGIEGVPHVGQTQFGKDAVGQGANENATHIMNSSSPPNPFPMSAPTSCRAAVVASYDQNSSPTSESSASKLHTYNISNGVPTTITTTTTTTNNNNDNNNTNSNTGNTTTTTTTNTNNNDNNNNNNNNIGTRKGSAAFYALDDFSMYDPLAVLDALPEYPMPAVV